MFPGERCSKQYVNIFISINLNSFKNIFCYFKFFFSFTSIVLLWAKPIISYLGFEFAWPIGLIHSYFSFNLYLVVFERYLPKCCWIIGFLPLEDQGTTLLRHPFTSFSVVICFILIEDHFLVNKIISKILS